MDKEEYKILIVEDEIFSIRYLRHILKSLGYKYIFEAVSNDEALDVVQKYKIDLVFMDINIDGSVDGITSAHLLNENYFLPIIFTTAYGDTSTISDASDTNIFGYLVKPFEQNDVEASLSVALKIVKNTYKNKEAVSNSNSLLDLGNNHIYNLSKKTLSVNGIPTKLTKKELVFLHVLCINIDHNVTYENLKITVWENSNISNSTIRDTLLRLRKKVPLLKIDNLSNYGYILKRQ